MAATGPSYYQSGAIQNLSQKEHRLHLYLFQHVEGTPGGNQKVIVNPGLPNMFGVAVATDWVVRDGVNDNANTVARARGFVLGDGMADQSWLHYLSIIFTDIISLRGPALRYLEISRSTNMEAKMLNGQSLVGLESLPMRTVLSASKYPQSPIIPNRRTYELDIRVFCLSVTPQVAKKGPWGGNGGTAFDISEPPRSLQSLTIRYNNEAIISFAYSYIDQAGQIKTAGPWGGAGGVTATITLGAPEVIKQIQGTVGTVGGDTVVTSLTLVTNVTAYPPFGTANGTTFSSQVPDDKSITGFYARAGSLLDALGVYYA